MKSALQQELQDLNGLPLVAGIVWTALIAICLLAIAVVIFKKNSNDKENDSELKKIVEKSTPKGF